MLHTCAATQRWFVVSQDEKRARLREAGRRKLDMFKRKRTIATACKRWH